MNLLKRTLQFFLFISVWFVQGQGKYLTIGIDSIKIYIEDAGKGKPIVFIPGWTMTSQFFSKQKDYFKKDHRYISYDPRSHGKSSKTEIRNTYAGHATDLYHLISALQLDDVILIGWSSGSATVYEYVKKYGTGGIDKIVFIDEPPKWVGDSEKEWVYGSFDAYRESLKNLINDRTGYAKGTVQWMLQKNMNEGERDWMVAQMMLTPNNAALSLYVDGLTSDYTDVAKSMNEKIPLLYLVRESWYDKAKQWLDKNIKYSKVLPIKSHAPFWENPEIFNEIVETFINGS
ncbi:MULTISPECIES: alpha/beta fold hydrolase [Flavobacteriaceae]|uniref:alpha/beta fold hydrolase n=1 Tax=Flavobacteriaceae TaxID=49546 RepID=UPI0014930089|nr:MULTISPECIES: alpha/beta hydrolase [Allomuricauda]MDC6366849.1 alpha/beta hydrolase [Muricauda sp. AC10]